MTNLRQVLGSAAMPSSLAETASLALTIMGGDASPAISHAEGTLQSSKEFAKTYALRRKMDYFRNRKVAGLDETIELLDGADRIVRLSYVQMEKALISIWLDETGQSICGLLVIESSD